MKSLWLVLGLLLFGQLLAQTTYDHYKISEACPKESKEVILNMVKQVRELPGNADRRFLLRRLSEYGHYDAVKYLVGERSWPATLALPSVASSKYAYGPLMSRSEYRQRPNCKDVLTFQPNERAEVNAAHATWLFDQGAEVEEEGIPLGVFQQNQLLLLKVYVERGKLDNKQKRKAFSDALRLGLIDMAAYFVEEVGLPVMPDGLVMGWDHPISHAKSYPELIAYLIERGATVNLPGDFPPLHFVTKTGCLPGIEQLLAAGADVNAKLPNGKTLLKHFKKNIRKGDKKAILSRLEEASRK